MAVVAEKFATNWRLAKPAEIRHFLNWSGSVCGAFVANPAASEYCSRPKFDVASAMRLASAYTAAVHHAC